MSSPAQQRSLRVRTRAGGEPATGEKQHHVIDDVSEDDDERSKGNKKTTAAVGARPRPASASTSPSSSSTWRPGRTLVWLAYLASWAAYAYVRATMSLDLGAYSW
jgi:hypothetical protein